MLSFTQLVNLYGVFKFFCFWYMTLLKCILYLLKTIQMILKLSQLYFQMVDSCDLSEFLLLFLFLSFTENMDVVVVSEVSDEVTRSPA